MGRAVIISNGADGQGIVFSSEPGRDDYTPAWQIERAAFEGEATLLTSIADVEAAAGDGSLTAHRQRDRGEHAVRVVVGGRTPGGRRADRTNVFMNGIDGPGPMGFQPSVLDTQAGDPEWSPCWDHMTYGWVDGVEPRLLTTEEEVHAVRDARCPPSIATVALRHTRDDQRMS